jgi:hypothetical protein
MHIILFPAKKMNVHTDLQMLWGCNDKIAELNRYNLGKIQGC